MSLVARANFAAGVVVDPPAAPPAGASSRTLSLSNSMRRSILATALAALAIAPVALRAQAPAAPEVGAAAPDFSLPAVGKDGKAKTVSLASLKGKVVVLAFYPGDRTPGCTAELTKFRDEYATLFGSGVVVLPISVDGIDSHAAWAKEANFPFELGADTKLEVAAKYGSAVPGRSMASRTVWVIGKDGKVAYRELRFGALNEGAYQALAAEVKKARG